MNSIQLSVRKTPCISRFKSARLSPERRISMQSLVFGYTRGAEDAVIPIFPPPQPVVHTTIYLILHIMMKHLGIPVKTGRHKIDHTV